MTSQTSRRNFLRLDALATAGGAMLSRVIAADQPDSAAQLLKGPGFQLLGNRFFTFNTVVRVIHSNHLKYVNRNLSRIIGIHCSITKNILLRPISEYSLTLSNITTRHALVK